MPPDNAKGSCAGLSGWRKWKDNPWVMFAGALFLLWLGGRFDNSPKWAEHQLLVSTEKTKGTVFASSVLLVLTHRPSGATAVILNKPEKDGGFNGGPLQKEDVIALQTLDVTYAKTKPIRHTQLGILLGKAAVEELQTAKKKPAWYRVFHGYASWAPGQLEAELKNGGWQLVQYDDAFVTKTPPEKMWNASRDLPVLHGR